MLDEVADYNAYDCRSTLRLRDWLLSLRQAAPAAPVQPEELLPPIPVEREPNPVYTALAAELADVDPLDRDADQTALALAAAAIDYHRREAKTFWQDHFDRLRNPVDDWADTRDVLVVERASVERDWGTLPRARSQSREIRLSGTLAPGSRIRPGGTPHLVYDDPLPPSVTAPAPGSKGASARAVVLDASENGEAFEVLVKESLPVGGGEPHADFPVALAPAARPVRSPSPRRSPSGGRRCSTRCRRCCPTPRSTCSAGSRRGERSPPCRATTRCPPWSRRCSVSTGPTSRSRALRAPARPTSARTSSPDSSASKAGASGSSGSRTRRRRTSSRPSWVPGVPADRVVKVPKSGATEDELDSAAWTPVKNNAAIAAFLSSCAETGTGGVVGGTAWTFANEGTIPRRSLDLLVVDEAGQFSLAPTIASSIAATRLLLLGDPQQLPQVSQGSHPEPVDQSALGWLADGSTCCPRSSATSSPAPAGWSPR